MDILRVIQERRSVRKYKNDMVPDEVIVDVIDAARAAPSWANTQVCQYIVVKDHKTKEFLSDTLTPTNPARAALIDAPVVLCILAKRGVSGCYDGKDTTKFSSWYMFDAGLAVQNLCLRAHDLGLGTVIVGLLDHDACKKILSVPDEYEVVVVIPVGKPAVAAKDGPPRRELKDFAHLDRFGNPMYRA